MSKDPKEVIEQSHTDAREKSSIGKSTSKCKGPRPGICLVYHSSNSREAIVTGTE